MLGGSHKFAFIGKQVFRLEASAFQNEIRKANTPGLRAGTNKVFLAIGGAEVDAFLRGSFLCGK